MNLTLPQQDVYFEQLLYPEDPIYNIGAKIEIKGKINETALEEAYRRLIEQHDAYRSVIIRHNENVRIKVVSEPIPSLTFLDFSTKKNPKEEAEEWMHKAFKEPFDLNVAQPLYKFFLLKISTRVHYLFSVYHHIITDGWGTSLMFQRLVQNYNELTNFGDVITNYPYQYQDFIGDDELYRNSEAFKNDKQYWKARFKHLPDGLFNQIYKRKKINTSKRKELIIKRPLYNQLSAVAKEYKSSSFHIILAIMYLYFGRRYQNTDFAIGVPVLNRGKSSFKKTVGLFMGMNALRIHFNYEETFSDLVQNIKQQLRQDYRHQRFPLGKLLHELGIANGDQKLFEITLSYEKQDYANDFYGTSTKVIPMTHEAERVSLALYVREFNVAEDVKIDFDYNLNCFDEQDISQIIKHIENLIQQIATGSNKKLSDYQYLVQKEQQQIIKGFNKTSVIYSKNGTILSFFNNQVKLHPKKNAIKDSLNTYSYGELDVLSTCFANYLTEKLGTEGKLPVGVLMSRNANLIAVLLGILKSGNFYIPMDPDFPKKRLTSIIEHSEVKCIIGEEGSKGSVPESTPFILIKEIYEEGSFIPFLKPREVKSSDTAYVIYTSGTTGKPKGVEISHQSLLNFLLSIQEVPSLNEKDLLFSVTTQSFDISNLEFFAPLLVGATVYVADKNMLVEPLSVINGIKEAQATILQATPSFYQMLLNAGWKGDKKLKLFCGGDSLSESLAEQLIKSCGEVWNLYGPTETTIWSSCKRVTTAKDANNIGRPLQNTQFYILDACKKILPVGTAGRIYIGGDGLAKGYFKNELLTNEKFIKNPFKESELMYDTGDIGKWNSEGEIEFLGRDDNQVKIRGYRIELGEIENQLTQQEAIKSAVVVVKRNNKQEALLAAFVITDDESLEMEAVKMTLRKALPAYMIPNIIIAVKSFPLTPNKKIDRNKLTSQVLSASSTNTLYQDAHTSLERNLCCYFKEVLDLEREVGIHDDFFALGGHSLNAVRLIGIIEERLNYHISLKTIFENPTVFSLSAFLQEEAVQNYISLASTEEKSHYPVTLAQRSIWLASLQKEKSIAYNMFRAFEVKGNLNEEVLTTAFQKIIDKYEVLRTSFFERDGLLCQKVHASDEVKFKLDTLLVENGSIQQVLENYSNQLFVTDAPELFRVGLIQPMKGENILIFVTHHIIMDGWSLEIMIKEMVRYYHALSLKKSCETGSLSFQFKDYVLWQRQTELKKGSANGKYWKQYLKDYRWKTLFPPDQLQLENRRNTGAFYRFQWDSTFLNQLKQTAYKNKVTLHTLLISTFNLLIYKIQKLEDICLGTINSGRPISALHDQIGMFVKTLPLRTKISSGVSVGDLLAEVQHQLLAIDAHQEIPEEVFNTLRFDAIMVLQNPTFDYESIHISEDLAIHSIPVDSRYNRLPLLLDFSVHQDKLHGTVHYNTGLYSLNSIEIWVLKFQRILSQLVSLDKVKSLKVEDIDESLPALFEDSLEINFEFDN
jgi:amino acid adenylation domain-containing protein